MNCPRCGKENPDDAQLCQSCGCVLTQSTVTREDINIKTSGLAIASMVLGILSVFTCGITAIPAVILGIISLVKIEKSGGRLTGRVFAIVGIVVPAVVCFLAIGLLMPALNRAREQGKRAVCLVNLRELTLAWLLYAEDNDDRIVNGAAGSNRAGELSWVGKDWDTDDLNLKRDAILKGALWTYCKNLKLYRCPSGYGGEMRTYSIVDSMNGSPQPGNSMGRGPNEIIDELITKNRMQISNPGQRVVFIDVGRATPGSFAVYYDKEQWWDLPPVRHRDGTSISFADGHGEYWKWEGAETIKLGKAADRTRSPSNVIPQSPKGKADLHRFQNAVWGKLGYEPKQ